MPRTARAGDMTACGSILIPSAIKTYVNGKLIIRIGDEISHGGSVVQGSPDVYAEGRKVARVGDMVSCSEHGINPIVEGSPDTITNS